MRIYPLLSAVMLTGATVAEPAAVDVFSNPPPAARPEVWWHWMNGNVTREGIVADLDAMKAVGLGGVTIFDAGCGVAAGPLKFGTEDWYKTLAFAIGEAAKRGLSVCLANCSGYSAAGGPWIAPSNAMKTVVWAATEVEGPGRGPIALPRLPDPCGYCRDIAVLAYPVPTGERPSQDEAGGVVTHEERTNRVTVVTITFPEPYSATRWEAVWTCEGWCVERPVTVEAEGESGAWRTVFSAQIPLVEQIQSVREPRSYSFAETRARRWRLTFDSGVETARLSAVRLGRGARIANVANKAWFVNTREKTYDYAASCDEAVPRTAIRDVTAEVDAAGRLNWAVPPGRWRILRVGYAANGRVCHPASEKGVGYESDKLSKAATGLHFDAYLGRVCDCLAPGLVGNPNAGFNAVLVDSWEAGAQNWTEDLERIFKQRKGYDLVPYLVAFSGVVVDDVATSERVLADFREVVAHLFAENFADELARKCHERGLKLMLEAYGTMPCTPELYGRAADIAMTEFWVKPIERIDDRHVRSVTERVRRTDRRKLIAAEAFTATPQEGRWQQDPFSLKGVGDHMYALGVNRMIYHRYAHQPWTNPTRYPGMTMGPWGTHYERTETWWYDQRGWIDYQTRTQALLQHGEFIAKQVPADKHDVHWLHRRDADGTDVFFVTCLNEQLRTVEVVLPVAAGQPELWDAETGERRRAAHVRTTDGKTCVTLDFKPSGAMFVVFPKTPTPGLLPAERREERARTPIEGPWDVSFAALYPRVPAPTRFDRLVSWSDRPEEDIRHFSGFGTYIRMLARLRLAASGERLVLDLGEVKNLATVSVDGKTYPTLWRPPFRVDITDAVLAATGAQMRVSVRVTNLWPNRLIGDAAIPEAERQTFSTWRHWSADDALLPSGWLGPAALVRERVVSQDLPQPTIEVTAHPGDCTATVQAALNEVACAGGGRVVLSAGRYAVGGLRLYSNTVLYLKTGAELVASREPAAYRIMTADQLDAEDVADDSVRWTPARERKNGMAPHIQKAGSTWNDGIIRIYKAENVAVIGEPGSVIDGCNSYDPRGEELYRGVHGISAHKSRNLTFRGYAIRRTGNWAHQLTACTDLEFSGLTVLGGHDGVHLSSCDRVWIRGCKMKTGDDCVAGFDLRDVCVSGCELNTACSAFRWGGTRLRAENCYCHGPAEYLFRGSLTREEKAAGAESGRDARRNMLALFTYYADKTLAIREQPGEIAFADMTVEHVDRLMHYNFSGNEVWQLGRPLASVSFTRLVARDIGMSLCAYGVAATPLRLRFEDTAISFARPVGEFIRAAALDSLSAERLSVEGVAGPMVRTWQGVPKIKAGNVKGVKPTCEPADVPFKANPI